MACLVNDKLKYFSFSAKLQDWRILYDRAMSMSIARSFNLRFCARYQFPSILIGLTMLLSVLKPKSSQSGTNCSFRRYGDNES